MLMIPDEPFLSPKRLWFAVMIWLYWKRNHVHISLDTLVRYHRRPNAADRDGVY